MADIPARTGAGESHPAFNVGDYIQAVYRRCWYGVIIAAVARSDGETIAKVRLVCTQDGRMFRKPATVVLHPYWLRKVSAFPLRAGAELA